MQRFHKILLTAFLSALLIFPTTSVFAEESQEEAIERNGTWLQLSPASRRLSLEPGKVLEDTLKVENTGERDIDIQIYATPYFVVAGTSDPNFEADNRYTQISRWITFLDDKGEYRDQLFLNLDVGESKDIRYKISIPEDVAGGGQYANIFAETIPDETQGITTSTRVGMTIYAGVAGETRTGSEILEVKSSHISFTGIVNVAADIKNTGNVDFQSSLEVTLSTLFGKDFAKDTAVVSVLPEATKVVSTKLEGPKIGIFRVHYKVKALDAISEKTHLVFVAPLFVVVLGFILIGLLGIAIVYLITKKTKRKDKFSLG